MPTARRLLLLAGIVSLALAGCATSRSARDEPASTPPTPPARTKPAPKPTHSVARVAPPRPRPVPTPRTTTVEPPPGVALPLPYGTGTARQVVSVVAPSTGSTTASVQAWARSGAGWRRVGPAVPAHLGSQGLSAHPSESLSATPIGSFGLTQAFGRAADPGTQLPYFRTDPSDWWVSDASSRYYNTHYRCGSDCPFDTGAGENLYAAGYVYTYAVVIDYNRAPVTPGAGSAFFLHVTDGSATAGCVSIPEADLVSIMKWLDPAAHPRILIGVR